MILMVNEVLIAIRVMMLTEDDDYDEIADECEDIADGVTYILVLPIQ